MVGNVYIDDPSRSRSKPLCEKYMINPLSNKTERLSESKSKAALGKCAFEDSAKLREIDTARGGA